MSCTSSQSAKPLSLVVLVLMLTMPMLVIAEDCLDYGELGGRIGFYPSRSNDVVMHGDIAYIGMSGSMQILDIRDPYAPQLLQQIDGSGGSLVLEGSRLYAIRTGGFEVFDVSDPASPVSLGSVSNMTSTPRAIDTVGNYLYALRLDGCTEVFDVQTPPDFTSVSVFGQDLIHFSVSGNLAAACCEDVGIQLFDVSDPQAPSLVSEIEDDCGSYSDGDYYTEWCNWSLQVELAGNIAYVYRHHYYFVDGPGGGVYNYFELVTYNVETPTSPTQLDDYFINWFVPGAALDILLDGDLAFVAMNELIEILDVNDPNNLVRVAELTSPVACRALAYENGSLAVAGDQVFLIPYPDKELLDFQGDGYDHDYKFLRHRDDYSFVLSEFRIDGIGYFSLNTFDLSDPNNPVDLNQLAYKENGFALRLELVGDLAIILDMYSNSLLGVDISNPLGASSLERIYGNNMWDDIHDFVINDGYVYVLHYSSDGSWLRILDLSQTSPILPGTIDIGPRANELLLVGDLLLACNEEIIWTLDVSLPDAPELVAECMVVGGGLHFLGAWDGTVFCRQNDDIFWFPVQPDGSLIVGGRITVDNPLAAAWTDSRLYVSRHVDSLESNLQVVDFTDFQSPILLGQVRLDYCAYLSVWSDRLFLIEGKELLSLPLQCTTPTSGIPEFAPGLNGGGIALHGAAPNPFNPRTEIFFTLERKRRIELAVFDLSGRQVAKLADAVFPAGTHKVAWSGLDQAGRSVASGVYLARLAAENEVASEKLLLLR